MTGDRAARVADAFARRTRREPRERLCTACVQTLHVSGAGVTLMSGRHSGPVCSSDERTGVLEDLQFTLGEGPCRDAYAQGRPVAEHDLRQVPPERWPVFTPPALDAGARGVFAFPLRTGASPIGVLTLYQDQPGGLSEEQAADSLVVADVLARTVLSIQSRGEPEVLAEGLTDGGAHRAEVHQASGMVAVQMAIDIGQALVLLRARAFAEGRPITEVAGDVVARRLRIGAADPVDGRG